MAVPIPAEGLSLKGVSNRRRALLVKTCVASVIVIATNVIGSYALKRGLYDVGILDSWSPVPYVHAFLHPWVAIGVILMIGWLLSRLALLSWADLTYVLPVSSFAYALSAAVGAIYLKEQISGTEWAGISAITLGVMLVALTRPNTTEPSR